MAYLELQAPHLPTTTISTLLSRKETQLITRGHFHDDSSTINPDLNFPFLSIMPREMNLCYITSKHIHHSTLMAGKMKIALFDVSLSLSLRSFPSLVSDPSAYFGCNPRQGCAVLLE